MTTPRHQRIVSLAALAVGAALFAGTLYYLDFQTVLGAARRLGVALPLALVASGAWHLTRTWAWSWCFADPRRVPFLRLLRVRMAAEAFSYLTISGLAGEPLKVMLLRDYVSSGEATASVALERISYIVGTALVLGIGSVVTLLTQPLTPVWYQVFRAFAIGSAVLCGGVALILIRRDSFLLAAFRARDRKAGSRVASGKVGRFIAEVGRQLGDLVHGNPRRLFVLALASGISYLLMASEVYLVLRAAGVEVTFGVALGMETFSRVASFASAVIPANIGALEASSVAAAAAMGATAAGAPIALARRLRGLFWAGIGLAIYPRHSRRAEDGGRKMDGVEHGTDRGPLLLYFARDGRLFDRVAGLAIAERVFHSARRARYAQVIALADAAAAPRLAEIARGVGGEITIVTSDAEWRTALTRLPAAAAATVIGPGTVVSPALLEDAASIVPPSIAGGVRDVPAGREWPVSGLLRVRAADAIDPAPLARELRDRLDARVAFPTGEDVSHQRGRLALHIRDAADLAIAERTIRRSSYKDTDNKLARWNRSISLPISIALIPTPITANQFSVALVAVGFYSAWLFSLGSYWAGVLGGFLSLAASVLDGCDGEIARLKYQESALGCWIETFGDYSYYLAIFVGLSVGAAHRTGSPIFYWLGAIALAGTLMSFALLIYLRSRITAGQPEKLHSIARARFRAEPSWWSRIIWRLSFVATRSAMPYGIFALSLVHLLPLVVILAAIGANTYWISLVLKLRHLLGGPESERVAA
jgi:phosphatidylglycerophosphate synthase